jgi:hypothetical protein
MLAARKVPRLKSMISELRVFFLKFIRLQECGFLEDNSVHAVLPHTASCSINQQC